MNNFANDSAFSFLEDALDNRDDILRYGAKLREAGREEGRAYGEFLTMLAEVNARIAQLKA
jgi:hypothetical protein